MLYLKIKALTKTDKKLSITKKVIRNIIELFINKANPDFENKISLVVYWLLEFEGEDNIPMREIGLGMNEEVLMKMPFKENYGYWTDNNLTFEDFQNMFKTIEITGEYFEEKWQLEPVL